jgi:hypothetical protein
MNKKTFQKLTSLTSELMKQSNDIELTLKLETDDVEALEQMRELHEQLKTVIKFTTKLTYCNIPNIDFG